MPRKKQIKQDILQKAKIARRNRYAKIKADPILYAKEKEKERQRYIKRKEQKKILLVAELSPKGRREQRKKWRENFRKHYQKKKMKQINENTLSSSETEEEQVRYNDDEPQPSTSTSKSPAETILQLRRRLGSLRYMLSKKDQTYKAKMESLRRKNEALKKTVSRLKKRLQSTNSNETITITKTEGGEGVMEAENNILFAEVIEETLESNYNEQTIKEEEPDDSFLGRPPELLKVHKILSETTEFTPRKKETNQMNSMYYEKLKNDIKCFFERDYISRTYADKKEFVTKEGERKEKRYLLESLKHTHKLFVAEFCKVSYSYFCKQRPFWVLIP